MNPNLLMQTLIIAAGATTDEEKARVCWRASDYLWRSFVTYGAADVGFCRGFNNLLQSKKWPWVKDLWSPEEIDALTGPAVERRP